MFTQEEKEYAKVEVKLNLMPEIKKEIPGIIAFLLKSIFPKLEAKIIAGIERIITRILNKRDEVVTLRGGGDPITHPPVPPKP